MARFITYCVTFVVSSCLMVYFELVTVRYRQPDIIILGNLGVSLCFFLLNCGIILAADYIEVGVD